MKCANPNSPKPKFRLKFIILAVPIFIGSSVAFADDANSISDLVTSLRNHPVASKDMLAIVTALVNDPNPQKVRDALKPLLSDSNPEVRSNGILAIGNVKGVESLPALRNGLQDPSGVVRFYSAYVLLEEHAELYSTETADLFTNAVLEDQLHHEFLLTLAGKKPISVTNCGSLCQSTLEKFRGEGLLTNHDIGWFFNRGTMISYSRSGIANLLAQPVLVKALAETGFPRCNGVDDAIHNFQEFWLGKMHKASSPTERFSQSEFDTISGIFFGYPLDEVLAYAGTTAPRKSGVDQNIFPDHGREKFFGWVVVNSAANAEVDELLKNGRDAVNRYHDLANKGLRALEIVNSWRHKPCAERLRSVSDRGVR